MNGMLDLALQERNGGPACDAGNRIPTSRYPVYATSKTCEIAAGDTSCTVTFEAERDTLFTDLSVELWDITPEDGPIPRPGFIDVTYCNVTYLAHSYSRVWGVCCDRKPLFLVGVRDNKKLSITVSLEEAGENDVAVIVSLSGFQGNGCCG